MYKRLILDPNLKQEDFAMLLEQDEDLDNIALILELAEANLISSEQESLPIYDDEEDELTDESEKKEKEDMRVRSFTNAAILKRIQEILISIKNRPKEFLGMDTHKKINGKIGMDVVPSSKHDRSELAKKIICSLYKSRFKSLGDDVEKMTRKDLASHIRQLKKDSSFVAE